MKRTVPWAGDESENEDGCECLHVGVVETDAECPFPSIFIQFFYLTQMTKYRIIKYWIIVYLFLYTLLAREKPGITIGGGGGDN